MPVRRDVAEIELLRKMEIDLNGRVGLFVTHNVRELNVELRPVEGSFTRSFGIRKSERVHRFANGV